MEKRAFGSTGVSVPVIGQGTWSMEEGDRAEAIAALRLGLDLGMTHVDTAEMYGDGAVEELVGEALTGRRAEAFLVSKVLPSNASRAGTVRACERSLRRLRTDYLDLYLLHWPGNKPLEETFAAFEDLVQQGKIRHYGVSNFDVAWMERTERQDLVARNPRASATARTSPIACNQVLYHLEERDIEHAVIPRCHSQGVAVVAYSPFGSGNFPSPRSAGGRVLAEVAAAHGATPRQVALRFLLREPGLFVIPKAARRDHIAENEGTGSLILNQEEIDRIDQAFPRKPARSSLPVI